jgi:cytochrome b involved in lipid metabolism
MFKKFLRSLDLRLVAASLSFACASYQLRDHHFRPPTVFNTRQNTAHCEQAVRVYRRAEVQKEARENKRVLVTYKDGVYDLTKFAKAHPGGSEKLLMASGGPIESWWQ